MIPPEKDDPYSWLETLWGGLYQDDMSAELFDEVCSAMKQLKIRLFEDDDIIDIDSSPSEVEFCMETILEGLDSSGTDEEEEIILAMKWIEDYLSKEEDEEDEEQKSEFESNLERAEQGDACSQHLVGYAYDYGEGVDQDHEKAFEWYMQAAEQGDATAQYSVGYAYDYGEGVDQDHEKAFEWHMKAAEQGDADSQYSVGFAYSNGEGVGQDHEKAFEWYMKAAEQGNASAQRGVGYAYDYGEGVEEDDEEAFEWYMKAAEQGDAEAQFNVGYAYDYGEGVDQDHEKAFEWYMKAAEQGNHRAQYNVGYAYSNGEGVEQDHEEAFEWYMKAAEQGDARAQRGVGRAYYFGEGSVDQDHEKGFEWFMKAAEQGDAKAQFNVGYAYKYGKGVEQDHEEAFEWYMKAAEQGVATAQSMIGYAYKFGEGVDQDHEKAFEWHMKAAEQGNAGAQFSVGRAYYFGEGSVDQDHEKGFEWLMKAAEQGDARAQCNVGLVYKIGKGVEQDHEEAMQWFRYAADQGNATAQKILEEEDECEDEISSTENDENCAIEKLSGDELKPFIIKTFEILSNNSCVYDQLETKVLKYLGSTLRGSKRKQIANRIKRAVGHLQSAGILKKYKNPGQSSNKRIRLTKDYTDKLPGLKKAWTRQSKSSTERNFEGSTIDTAPARPNSSLSEKTYSLSELESMGLDKEYKPRTLIIGDQDIEVKNWTELSTKFVEWLIEKNYLSKNDLPIYTFSERDKYFINYEQRHENTNKDGLWKPVGDFFVDAKYNADGHKKNIIYTLKHLRIDDVDIKISFRNVGTPNEPAEKNIGGIAGKETDYKSIQVPDLNESDGSHEFYTPFSGEDTDEEFDHDEETTEKLDTLSGDVGESNASDSDGDAATSLGQKVELPSDAIFSCLVDSLSSIPGISASQQSDKIIVFLHQEEIHDIKINLEIKEGYLVAESFFPPNASMMERLLEVSGSPDFSCKFGKERNRYVVRRNCEIKNRPADDIHRSILEVVSDVKKVNDVLLEG